MPLNQATQTDITKLLADAYHYANTATNSGTKVLINEIGDSLICISEVEQIDASIDLSNKNAPYELKKLITRIQSAATTGIA